MYVFKFDTCMDPTVPCHVQGLIHYFPICDYFEDCTGKNFKIWYVGMVIFTYLVQYEECTCQLPQMKYQTSQEKCKEAGLKLVKLVFSQVLVCFSAND